MKHTAKMILAMTALLALSACAQTSGTSQVFSNYDYSAAVYSGYAPSGYIAQGNNFSINNHY